MGFGGGGGSGNIRDILSPDFEGYIKEHLSSGFASGGRMWSGAYTWFLYNFRPWTRIVRFWLREKGCIAMQGKGKTILRVMYDNREMFFGDVGLHT